MTSEWHKRLKQCEKSFLVQNGRITVRYLLKGLGEMVEEYDFKSHCLIGRKWKRESLIGKDGKWEIELGDSPPDPSTGSVITASLTSPMFKCADTSKEFQWRIRNLPYPIETYSLEVDATGDVILRTSNKKYYKKLSIPSMTRCGIPVDRANFSMTHANSTLLIAYPKPKQIVDFEATVVAELKKRCNKDGDVGLLPENTCCLQ